jgi:uncharacterized protein (UPF0332 family)/predicted nucleotidyltransferase
MSENEQVNMDNLSEDAKKKLEGIKNTLDKLKDALLKKFDNYLTGVALLPPPKPEENQKINKDQVNVLLLIDDSDSQKLSKEELKENIEKAVEKIAKNVDKNITPQVLIHSELWQSCYDAKYEVLQMVAISAPIYDKGLLGAIKISEIHKSMVLKKFEKYIISYVLTGSLVRGEATETSDIDVMIIIDDTDVKKMTRGELKDKLRAIIIGMGMEAGGITGILNKLNIQVYILTDFWDNLREANPVIFTLLRDGIPFYDRGIFMPWKQLLKMGKIKPSQEAIDMFMTSGDQMLKRVEYKIKEIGMEDIYYAILSPSQAALMLYGLPPPAPRETAKLMNDIFVKKEKMLEEKYVKILSDTINVRKELEHGTLESISGKKLDQMMTDAQKYLKRINKLFEQIQENTEKESIKQIYDDVITITTDILKNKCDKKKISEQKIADEFNNELVCKGEIPRRYLRILKDVISAKKDFDNNKISKTEVSKIKKQAREYIRFIIEHLQRSDGINIERSKIRVKYNDKFGEIVMLEDSAFIIKDIDSKNNTISKGELTKDGKIKNIKDITIDEFEKALTEIKNPKKISLKQETFNDIKKIFGDNAEILISY